jgi:hypothetical protein
MRCAVSYSKDGRKFTNESLQGKRRSMDWCKGRGLWCQLTQASNVVMPTSTGSVSNPTVNPGNRLGGGAGFANDLDKLFSSFSDHVCLSVPDCFEVDGVSANTGALAPALIKSAAVLGDTASWHQLYLR